MSVCLSVCLSVSMDVYSQIVTAVYTEPCNLVWHRPRLPMNPNQNQIGLAYFSGWNPTKSHKNRREWAFSSKLSYTAAC